MMHMYVFEILVCMYCNYCTGFFLMKDKEKQYYHKPSKYMQQENIIQFLFLCFCKQCRSDSFYNLTKINCSTIFFICIFQVII